MKKLNNIAIVAMSLISVAVCAADKSNPFDLKLKQYNGLAEHFNKECSIPMGASIAGRWVTTQYQRNGCNDLIKKLDALDYELNKSNMAPGTHRGPAREFWKN